MRTAVPIVPRRRHRLIRIAAWVCLFTTALARADLVRTAEPNTAELAGAGQDSTSKTTIIRSTKTPISRALAEAQSLLDQNQNGISFPSGGSNVVITDFSDTALRIQSLFVPWQANEWEPETYDLPLEHLSPDVRTSAVRHSGHRSYDAEYVVLTITCAEVSPGARPNGCITITKSGNHRNAKSADFNIVANRMPRLGQLLSTAISTARIPFERALKTDASRLADLDAAFSLVEKTFFGTTLSSYVVTKGLHLERTPGEGVQYFGHQVESPCGLLARGEITNQVIRAVLDKDSNLYIAASGAFVIVDGLRLGGVVFSRRGVGRPPDFERKARLIFGFNLAPDAARGAALLNDWFKQCQADPRQ